MDHSKVYSNLPKSVKSILLRTNGWLVGGALSKIEVGEKPKDYDIIVPDKNLYHNYLSAFDNLQVNTFGGVKIELYDHSVVDIWCEDLDHFLLTCMESKYIYSLRKGILFERK